MAESSWRWRGSIDVTIGWWLLLLLLRTPINTVHGDVERLLGRKHGDTVLPRRDGDRIAVDSQSVQVRQVVVARLRRVGREADLVQVEPVADGLAALREQQARHGRLAHVKLRHLAFTTPSDDASAVSNRLKAVPCALLPGGHAVQSAPAGGQIRSRRSSCA